MKNGNGAPAKAGGNLTKSLIKAQAVIELLHEHGSLTLTELCQLSGMDKTTVFRLLYTLREIRYVVQNPESQKYSNSGTMFMLGQGVLHRLGLNQALNAELRKLAEKTGAVVNFGVPDGMEIAYLLGSAVKSLIKLEDRTGTRVPMYCSAAGKAVLALYKPEYIKGLCRKFDFRPYTENTITTPRALLADLKETRARGYAVDRFEHNKELCCTALAVTDPRGTPVAVTSMSVPAFRFREEPDVHEICGRALLEASAALTAALLS